MSESTGEKTEKPSAKKLKDAREKGQVVRSLYELKGDTLRVCRAFEGTHVRPRAFGAPGTLTYLGTSTTTRGPVTRPVSSAHVTSAIVPGPHAVE